jgi:hypothetical protein
MRSILTVPRAVSIVVVARVIGAVSKPMRTILTMARAISIILVAISLRKNGERYKQEGGANHERDFELHIAGPKRV